IGAAQKRGRSSGRRVLDKDALLDAYAAAVAAAPRSAGITVGVAWREAVAGLVAASPEWRKLNVSWAATGLAGASLLAPVVTSVGSAELYVNAKTPAELEAFASRLGLKPIDGGRLTIRPYPTVSTRRLLREVDGVPVAPWPRVYADTKGVGVRGEEAAEHLREVMH